MPFYSRRHFGHTRTTNPPSLTAPAQVNRAGDAAGRTCSSSSVAYIAGAVAVDVEAEARRRVLGRGAHGVVYVSNWRGRPCAVKLMNFAADAAALPYGATHEGDGAAAAAAAAAAEMARRRERMAREVALTITLRHDNVVPSYNYYLDFVPAEVAASPSGGLHELLRLT